MLYFYLKTLHVVFGALIVGVAASSSLLFVFRQKASVAHERLLAAGRSWLRVNGLLVVPMLIVQMVLGFSVVSVRQYALTSPWLMLTFTGFFALLLTWLRACMLMLQYVNEDGHSVLYKQWLRWVCVAIATLVLMIFMMANRPGY